MTYEIEIPANTSLVLPFTIAGSYHSLATATATYQEVQGNAIQLLKDKKTRYESILAQTQLIVPDKNIQQAFKWLKYSTDWLVRDVPEIGRGLSAGLPDYPWWFGVDNEYALQGALMIGRFDIVEQTIDLLVKSSEKENKGNGRILHEMSTNGAVLTLVISTKPLNLLP
ncbi:MAG: hypothetical protein R2822_13840 [Spirosomataceae bacterium]